MHLVSSARSHRCGLYIAGVSPLSSDGSLVPPLFEPSWPEGDYRFDAASGMLTRSRGAERTEFSVPAWGRRVAEFIVNTPGSWSVAVLHDLVDAADVPFVNVVITQMADAGLIEPVAAASGGVASVSESTTQTFS